MDIKELMTQANNVGKRIKKVAFYQVTFFGFSIPVYQRALKKNKNRKESAIIDKGILQANNN